jgi:predicted transcriptional regulator
MARKENEAGGERMRPKRTKGTARSPSLDLSRRERQIMDVLYRLGSAGVWEVQEGLPDPPGYSAVRAMLGKLETKGYLMHRQEGARYVYEPTMPREEARDGALARMIRTFFDGSAAQAAAAVLDFSANQLTDAELAELAAKIEETRQRGR